jgi:glycerophosphoryl diester phosphodiesterase
MMKFIKSIYFKQILIIVVWLNLLACNNHNMSSINPIKKLDTQGHRGCRGLMPENTISAMLHALALGVTTLEMDVVITKDKQVILSHEPFFNHEITTKPNGLFVTEVEEKSLNIFNYTYAETQQFDVGLKSHPRFVNQQKIAVKKPLLNDVIDSVRLWTIKAGRPFPHFNIETKTNSKTDNIYHPEPAVFVDLLMQVITQKQIVDYVIIQSFDLRTLQYLHKKYPTIKTALLIEDTDTNSFEDHLQTLGFTPTIYSPHYSLATKTVIEKCHQKNVKIIPWTVNELVTMKNLITLGVDGIISDYPNLFNDL